MKTSTDIRLIRRLFSSIDLRMLLSCFILVAVLILSGMSKSFAVTKTWASTSTGGSWSTGSNWTGGVAPVAGDDIVFTFNSGSPAVTGIPGTSFGSLTVNGATTGTVSLTGGTNAGSFTTLLVSVNTSVGGFGSGSFTITGGSVSAGKTLSVNVSNFAVSTGPFTVSGTLSLSSGFTTNAIGAVSVAAGGVLNWTRNSLSSVPLLMVQSGGIFNLLGSNTRNFSNGSLSVAGKLSFQGTVSGGSTGTAPTFSPGSTLEYAQTAAANTGAEWPTGTSNLPSSIIINNAAGVTINTASDHTVPAGGNLNIQSGTLTVKGGGDLIIETTATITQTTPSSNYIITPTSLSSVVKKFTSSASQSFTYPIGSATNYRAVEINITGNSAARSVGVNTSSPAGEPHVYWNNGCTPSDYTKCYWGFSHTGSGNWNYQLTFHYQLSDFVGTTPSDMLVSRTISGAWTTYPTTYNAQPYIQMNAPAANSTDPIASSDFMGRYCGSTLSDPTGITASANPVCSGSSATLTVQGGSNGGGSWVWYAGNCGGTVVGSGTSVAVMPTSNTTYFVRGENGGNYTSCVSVTVNVTALPAVPAVTSPVTYCLNETASPLTATGTSLLWYTFPAGGTGTSTSPAPATSATGTITYYVSQTVNGCEGPRAGIDVTVYPNPLIPVITQNGNTLSSSAATGNQWCDSNNNPIPGATNQTYDPPQSGNYYVVVTDANGCSSQSALFNFIWTGIETAFKENSCFAVSPNPASSCIIIEMGFTEVQNFALLQCRIYDIPGTEIINKTFSGNKCSIDIRELAKGLYILKVESEKGFFVKKFIKK